MCGLAYGDVSELEISETIFSVAVIVHINLGSFEKQSIWLLGVVINDFT